jgi:hypothetical protein
MNRDLLVKHLKIYEDEFKHFMGIEEFPVFELQTQKASINIADSQGFEIAASTSYQQENRRHTLLVSSNIDLSKYLIFHEFTHMLDSEMYVKYSGLIVKTRKSKFLMNLIRHLFHSSYAALS